MEQAPYECGPAALESVLRYWGEEADASALSKSLSSSPHARGVLNFALAQQMKDQGFWTQMESSDLEHLREWVRRGIPPVVALHVGRFGVPIYHFVVITGFDTENNLFYLNAGRGSVESITAAQLDARWQKTGRWTLVICPAEKVDWPLNGRQAAEMGLLYEKRGDLTAAQRWYQQAADQEPDNRAMKFNLANVHLKKGELEQARLLFEQLAAKNPSWSRLQNNLAWTRLNLGDAAGAVRTVRTAFQHGARARPEILDTLGLSYCRLGDNRRALASFRSAAARVPSRNKEMQLQIALHQRECGR